MDSHPFENPDAGKEKGLMPLLGDAPAEQVHFFAMVRCFSFTGAF
jgi:hypothetical protein